MGRRVVACALASGGGGVVYCGGMPTSSSPSQSAEDYLERIHELIERKGYARVVDIASSLKVRQASVTSMVQKLAEAGFCTMLVTDACFTFSEEAMSTTRA